ncbi:hypothetical protein LEN26_016044 [Aphanomyces euteiches]|nr:hypothetical protein LEN26_016044 [Aphanomyces euteiches]KAH9116617.1 hypothetical protein AeMF1_009469 [Aphanomyces euteiches]KAH9191453.1 hypothetical protein AeNC1_006580 [Aphanomyces euteiches]
MTTTMNIMPMLAPDYSHLYSHVEVDGFTFQDLQSPSDFDFDNDADAAKDIDDFTSLLATVEDEETARDIDEFASLMSSLSNGPKKEDELSDVSIDDLLNVTSAEPTPSVRSGLKVRFEDAPEDDSDDEDDEEEPVANTTSLPFHFLAPIDPRCVIQTPVFKTLDSRIPMVSIPKMDVAFGSVNFGTPTRKPLLKIGNTITAPNSPSRSSVSSGYDGESSVAYVHDADKCWVCKSGKSEERKRVLHRYVEKRYRRNWKRGARYTARSRVASSRVREGGRFVTKCEWVAVGYD